MEKRKCSNKWTHNDCYLIIIIFSLSLEILSCKFLSQSIVDAAEWISANTIC